LPEEGIEELLGKESAKIVILSHVEIARISVEQSMAYDAVQKTSLASSHTPLLLLTNSAAIKKMFRDGNIEEWRRYIAQELEERGKALKIRP
jgi:hypothetical protein